MPKSVGGLARRCCIFSMLRRPSARAPSNLIRRSRSSADFDLLRLLFSDVVIPPAVFQEVVAEGARFPVSARVVAAQGTFIPRAASESGLYTADIRSPPGQRSRYRTARPPRTRSQFLENPFLSSLQSPTPPPRTPAVRIRNLSLYSEIAVSAADRPSGTVATGAA